MNEKTFAELIQQDYMWTQRPPIRSYRELGRLLGEPASTVHSWVVRGVIPDVDKLPNIARITGIPLIRLLRACNVPIPETIIDADTFIQFLITHLGEKKAFTREEVANRIIELQSEYLQEQQQA